jgi:hypothetical protein
MIENIHKRPEQLGVNATGAPIRDPHINVEFHSDDGSVFTVFLMGLDCMTVTPEQESAAIWAYLRRYMEEGPENLPGRKPSPPRTQADRSETVHPGSHAVWHDWSLRQR